MKITKRIISVILSVSLLLIPMLTLTANATDKDNRQYPTIEIWGFMAGDIYAEANNADSDVLWPITADFILDGVKQLLPSIAKLAATWNWKKFGEESTPILQELLGTAILDTNGDPSDGSGVYFNYPPAQYIAKDSVLTFRYDWRLDPMVIAEQIHDFIEYVCAASGSDQVCLTCHSLGGVMTLTYVSLYGDSRIHSIVMNSTAVYGETYNGELMTGNIVLNGEAISEYLQCVLTGNEYEELLDSLMIMLDDMHLTDFIAKFGNLIISKMAKYWIPAVVLPLFAYWPSIWSMIPDSYVEEAKDYVFNQYLAGNGVDYSQLIAKIDSFNTVRENREALLEKLNEDANLYVLTRYGFGSVPVSPSWEIISDGVIDTKNASYGATVTSYGTIFADSYITEENAKYISPDRTVDATTCKFPEQTWFIKGMEHSKNSKYLDAFILDLLHYDGQATVDTFEQYPRFLAYDKATTELFVDGSAPAPKLTGWAKFTDRVKRFFSFFKDLFLLIIKK